MVLFFTSFAGGLLAIMPGGHEGDVMCFGHLNPPADLNAIATKTTGSVDGLSPSGVPKEKSERFSPTFLRCVRTRRREKKTNY